MAMPSEASWNARRNRYWSQSRKVSIQEPQKLTKSITQGKGKFSIKGGKDAITSTKGMNPIGRITVGILR